MGAKEIRAAARAKTAKKSGGKSWFEDFITRGTRGTDAPIGLGERTEVNENPNALPPLISGLAKEASYVDPLYQDAPVINPQAVAAAYGNRVTAPTTDLGGAPVQAPVKAPVQRQPIRQIQAAPSAPSVYPQQVLQRRGLDVPQRPTHADRLAMLDANSGADAGYGINW